MKQICSRGKAAFDSIGNRRLRILLAINLKRYVEGDRLERSKILTSIVDQIYQAKGRFVKKDDNGEWREIGYEPARDKVGHTFRDALRLYRLESGRSISRKKASPCEIQDAIFERMNIQTLSSIRRFS